MQRFCKDANYLEARLSIAHKLSQPYFGLAPVIQLTKQGYTDNNMSKIFNNYINTATQYLLLVLVFSGLTACQSDEGENSNQGYIKFYNASHNSPGVHLTIDEDLATSDDDEIEVTFSAVNYGKALTNSAFKSDKYYFELAWQDGDSSQHSELALIYQDELTVKDDMLHFIVLSEDILSPNVQVYDIPLIDDSDDDLYDRFNVRLLNLHSPEMTTDIYVSKSDETFVEAKLLGSYSYQQLSDNQKLDQGSYVFYLTKGGSDEVLFQSKAIDYYYSAQYIMVIRENNGAGSSPFVLDKLSNSSVNEYIDFNAEAQFNVYNAITENPLLPAYSGDVTMHINNSEPSLDVESLHYGQVSDLVKMPNGDYSIDLVIDDQSNSLLKNHLLSLPENSNRTVFFFADEENVDEDGDGDVDENGDGIVDQKEVKIHSLVVDNTTTGSIYNHQINIVNLVDSDDFTMVNVYFVRSDETISTALHKRSVVFASNEEIQLTNNSYQVYVVAKDNSSDVILTSFALTLNDTSVDQFLVIENSETSASGYKATMFDQIID